jgi:hypothetical protein
MWKLWAYGEVWKRVPNILPRLASWDSFNYPSQVKLQAYLDHLMSEIGSLPLSQNRLFLHLVVDVEFEDKLLHHHDLENYLTPLFGRQRLPPSSFCLVSATKRVGGGSELSMGFVTTHSQDVNANEWEHFALSAGGGTETKEWKLNLRKALELSRPNQLKAGPAEVVLAWRCTSNRNWANLWKPTGDTMGPVLGENLSRGYFHPYDDRITSLSLHLNIDESMRHSVDVGMWWRPAK